MYILGIFKWTSFIYIARARSVRIFFFFFFLPDNLEDFFFIIQFNYLILMSVINKMRALYLFQAEI